jgi:hypothetical protein
MVERVYSYRRFAVGSAILLCIALLSLGNFNNPPNGFTGAPGESLCTECHSLNGGNQNGTVLINGFPSTAIANQIYPLIVTVANPNGIAEFAGFQMVVLDANNQNAGTLTNPGPFSVVTTAGGRTYHEHNPAQQFGMSNVIMWTVDWTAPVGSGLVTYYAAGNVANGSGTDNGDLIVTATGSGTLMTPLTLEITSVQDVSCFGGMDGSVTAEATYGMPGYTYAWSNGGSGPMISGLGIGTYTVTATDNAGATATASAELTQPPVFEIVSTSLTHVSCNGGSDGQIMLFLNGGVPPYSGAVGDTYTLSNLQAGTYVVNITDANGCLITEEYTITEPPLLNIEVTVIIDPECTGEFSGLISVAGSGGAGMLVYAWSNGESSETIQNLEAGSYTVTVTDDNGCTVSETIDLDDPDLLFIDLVVLEHVSCNGAADGQILVEGIGGTGSIAYMWSDGGQDPFLEGLPPGSYAVTITDDNGCTDVANYDITEPEALSAVISGTMSLLCFGDSDGLLSTDVTGGAEPYSYLWTDGQTQSSISGLVAGIYDVTVTDASGCVIMESFEIHEPAELLPNATSTNESAPGNMDGTATSDPIGGVEPYEFLWSTGAMSSSITGLSVGVYTVTVTDANGCTSAQSVTVTGVDCNLTVSTLSTDAFCFGEASGTSQAVVSGALGHVSFLWSNGDTMEIITGLVAGTYSVTVTDSAGCLFIAMTTISQPSQLSSNCIVTHESSEDAADGSITCTIGGGTAPYSFLWSNGDTTASLTDLAPGSYSLTTTDDHGCTLFDTVVVNSFACNVIVSVSIDHVPCFGDSTGSILAIATGGSEPYQYVWSNGLTGPMLTDLTAGSYHVTVTDADDCVSTLSVALMQPDEITIVVDSVHAVMNGADGAVFITISGGTPPYAVMWTKDGEPVSSDEDINGLSAGDYVLEVTDVNSCTITSGTVTVQVTTGIDDLTAERSFLLAPNPVISRISLSTRGSVVISYISIRGTDGSTIRNWDVLEELQNQESVMLDVNDLQSGLYYLLIQGQKGVEVHPFIKVE